MYLYFIKYYVSLFIQIKLIKENHLISKVY